MNWTKIVFIAIILAMVVLGIIFYRPVFSYLIASLVFAYILDPLVTSLEYRRVPRWLSVLMVYAVIAGVLALFTTRMVPMLINQGNNLMALFQYSDKPVSEQVLALPFVRSVFEFLQNIDKQVPSLGFSAKFVHLIETGNQLLGELPKLLVDNYQTILSMISFVITVPVFSFFMLKDKQALRKGMLSLVPNRFFELAVILQDKIDETVGRFLRAMLLEVIAVSIMTSVALTIAGVPYAVLIGITAGVANIIPYIGPWMGAALAVLTVLITGKPLSMMIYAALAMYLVQVLDNNFVYPVVVGKTIRMHPLIVLVTVLAGGWFGGIIWMLFSVPLVYIVYSLVRELYINLKQFRLI